jgi:predicted ABC-type exoprotein transport system permease subunit
VRFRRGHGDERQQLKWMLAPVILVVVLNVPTFLGVNAGDVLSVVQAVVMLLIPVAITAAILRYRLYDIDRLISRTIAYAVVLALLVTLFVLGNLALQGLLEGLTQGDTLAVAASTLVAFAAAQPLWRRVRHLVDQRFDRARIDAARTAEAFTNRQRDRVDLEAVVDDVRETANASLRPASIGVWLRGNGA